MFRATKVHLNKFKQEFANNKQIQLEWTQDVVEFIANEGFDPLLGARPIIELMDKKFA